MAHSYFTYPDFIVPQMSVEPSGAGTLATAILDSGTAQDPTYDIHAGLEARSYILTPSPGWRLAHFEFTAVAEESWQYRPGYTPPRPPDPWYAPNLDETWGDGFNMSGHRTTDSTGNIITETIKTKALRLTADDKWIIKGIIGSRPAGWSYKTVRSTGEIYNGLLSSLDVPAMPCFCSWYYYDDTDSLLVRKYTSLEVKAVMKEKTNLLVNSLTLDLPASLVYDPNTYNLCADC